MHISSPSRPATFAVWRALWLLAGLLALLLPRWTSAAEESDFLDPLDAFRPSVSAPAPDRVTVEFTIAPGYYLYREQFAIDAKGAVLGAPQYPPGHVKFDETFQKEVETYRDRIVIDVPLQQVPAAAYRLTLRSQGCADAGLCYPPQTQTYDISPGSPGQVREVTDAGPLSAVGAALGGLPRSGESDEREAAPPPTQSGDRPAVSEVLRTGDVGQLLAGGSFWAVVGAFAVLGLLLAFTPCVLPMLPILSSIIVGGGEVGRARGLALAVAYSLGMALVYTVFGVAAGLAGEGLAATLQHPAVLTVFAAVIVLMALSLFGAFELRLPAAWSTGLDQASRKLGGGRFVGVFLMGGLSALIVSPCVTAPLAGALLFISRTGDVWLGGAALFALAVGMSVPLIALGASAGQWLPRSGAWMHAVSRAFGMLMLATALWIIQPVLPHTLALVLWGFLLLMTGFMCRPFDAHPHAAHPRTWLQRAVGLAALCVGLLQFIGAAAGGTDPLQPLGPLAMRSGGSSAAGIAAVPADHELTFERVNTVAELDDRIARAGRPVMVDFYADWCVSCKEMERYTYADPGIRGTLSNMLLLKVDVTANSADDKALLRRFELFGPPGIIFFDAAGQERSPKVVGYQNADRFAQSIEQAGL